MLNLVDRLVGGASLYSRSCVKAVQSRRLGGGVSRVFIHLSAAVGLRLFINQALTRRFYYLTFTAFRTETSATLTDLYGCFSTVCTGLITTTTNSLKGTF
jgi:hypothetical protein